MRLKIRKSENLGDWWIIERAEHDGRTWLEAIPGGAALRCSSRFSDADVEGDGAEMLAIATAIQCRTRVSFDRCAVDACASRSGVAFRSPRNSQTNGVCSLDEADELAAEIRRVVPAMVEL